MGMGDTLLDKCIREKKIARDFVERRHEAWLEIYELYRNKVRTNRLTQRQAVNMPLMKETVKTLLSKIDEPPVIEFKELAGDEEKEIILQEMWNTAMEEQNFEGIDIQDKKTVLLYGRGFKKLNWDGDTCTVQALDIYDVIIDPMVDPLDIETARFIIHQNIFKPLREILADDRYTAKGKEALKLWATTPSGIVQSGKNKEEWEKKLERLKALGVNSTDFPLFAAGDVIVNLCEHFTNVWDTRKKEFERRVIVYADDQTDLMNESLVDALGVDFYPFVTWAEDIETSDFFSDGPADLVRVPNKVLNIWFSQMVENRTLRNFQMHWYDATIQGYKPQTYEPGPGRMLPAPGDPNKTILPVEVSGLDDTFNAIEFITGMIERGTAATAIEKGESSEGTTTLGEVQILVGKAMERTLALAKFYRRSWQELAMKWYRIMDANQGKKVTLYKLSREGKIWPKAVYPSDWKSKAGFKAFARSGSEQEADALKTVQKFQFVMTQYPQNQSLRRIAQRRMLEVVDLTPEEIREIVEEEKRNQMMLEQQAAQQQQLMAAQTANETAQAGAATQEVTAGGGQNPLDAAAGKVAGLGEQGMLQDKLDQFINAAGTESDPIRDRFSELATQLA